MARTRSIEHPTPSGEAHVVERDEEGRITGVSNALACREYMDDECQFVRPDFDPWDVEFEQEDIYRDDEDRAEAALFLASFD